MIHKLVRSRAVILAAFVILAMAVAGCGILSRAEAPEAEHEDGRTTESISASRKRLEWKKSLTGRCLARSSRA